MSESERYKRIIEDSRDGFWLVDLKGNLLEANKAYADMSGYSVGELVNMHVTGLDTQDDKQKVKARIKKLLAHGHDRFETKHRHKDGHFFDVDVSIKFIAESNEIFAFIRENSERRLYEKALLESEEKYRGLFENAGDLAYGTDLKGNFTAISGSLFKITGYRRDELINVSISKILTPENFELARRMTAAKLGAEKQVTRYELEILSKEGRLIPLELVSTLTYKDGVPVGVQGIGRDISERKRFETDLRIAATAFESQGPMVITDVNGVIQRVNKAFTLSTGYAAEDAVGQTPRLLKSDRHDANFFRAMWASIHYTGTWQGEIWNRRKNGEVYPKLLTISAVKDNNGIVTHYVGAHVDITERIKAEEILKESMSKLEEKELAKSRFLASASHDLRQPLAAANLFIDALKFTNPTSEQDQIIQRLDLAMSNFNGLLDSLLNVSKLDAGMIKPRFRAIDVAEIFNWLEQSFEPLVSEKGLGFRLYFPVKEKLIIRGDIDLIKSVLMNLVANAIKFTPQGGILVSARPRGSDVLFQVWDTGIGMQSEHIEYIFDEFYKIGNPQRDRTSGLGLGLSIAKRALALFDGEITCRSKAGSGSVFQFRLPMDDLSGDVLPTVASSSRQDGEQFVRGKRFVIVEDDVLIVEALSRALQGMGGEGGIFS